MNETMKKDVANALVMVDVVVKDMEGSVGRVCVLSTSVGCWVGT